VRGAVHTAAVFRNLRLLLAYDGTGFRGWAAQRDPGIRTVEGALTQVLSDVVGEPVKLAVAGRTDAGVHARGQVASFTTDGAGGRAPDRLRDAINARLGPEVVALGVRQASAGFHARFSATAREYRYRVELGPVADPFTARFVWHRPGDPDVQAMRAAAAHLVGEHDFTSFCRHPGRGKPTVRRMERISVSRRQDSLVIAFRANAFLHQMVRSLTGTLMAIGDGAVDPEAIPAVLSAKDRARAGQLAPACGLTLERVVYGRGVALGQPR
jgi:tRNA pseudouridine38-40 synthase